MKKFFSLFALTVVFIAGIICTSCSHSYDGYYFDVHYVDGITESEAADYDSLDSRNKLLQILRWNRDKPEANRETKEGLNEDELFSYLKSKNCSDEDAQDIIDNLNTLQIHQGTIESFTYTVDSTKYYMYFFFEIVQ